MKYSRTTLLVYFQSHFGELADKVDMERWIEVAASLDLRSWEGNGQ